MKRQITMLGTGHATVTKCYNTCFLINNNGEYLLTDAGGGNGILTQLEKAEADIRKIHTMFISHAHTDHLLGGVWVIRKVLSLMIYDKYAGDFTVLCDEKSARLLKLMCEELLFSAYIPLFRTRVHFRVLNDGDTLHLAGASFRFFDVHTKSLTQFGFTAQFADGFRLCFFGDEPINESCAYARDCDMLICEAYCKKQDADLFRPYEKHHSTAADAALAAQRLGVKRLLLCHTEDSRLEERKQSYTTEAAQYFTGEVLVPDDSETVLF